jgi:hypothetical protein
VQAKQFLKESGILFPADDTLRRLIVTQKQAAREYIYVRVADSLSSVFKERLDEMLIAGDKRLTPFQSLKESPGKASPNLMLRLATKLELIQLTGILDIDLSWLNNNYQRSLTRYARRCSADRMRNLKEDHRYTVLVCFNLVVERFSYIRQFAPTLLEQLDFRLEEGVQSTLVDAVKLLRQLNEDNKRKLPDDVPYLCPTQPTIRPF